MSIINNYNHPGFHIDIYQYLVMSIINKIPWNN